MPRIIPDDADDVRAFFAWSDLLDHAVLRPLAHVRSNWEITWDQSTQKYLPEQDSFAQGLNLLIDEIATTMPPQRYHDQEDIVAELAKERLHWPIRKKGSRWIGGHYETILEQGSCGDADQMELVLAASGRVRAAIRRGQLHFDSMEISHRAILGGVMAIVIFHRSDFLP